MYKVIQFTKLASSPEDVCLIEAHQVSTWELKATGNPLDKSYSLGLLSYEPRCLFGQMGWFPISVAEYLRLSKCLTEPNNDEVHFNDNKA